MAKAILKYIVILGFSSSLPLLVFGQGSVEELPGEPEWEHIFLTEKDDTFFIIAQREFGHIEIGLALAEYNRLPFNTVFSAQQEVAYPGQFAAKPNSVEVLSSRGDVNYQLGGTEYSIAQIAKGDTFFSTDVITTGPEGFLVLELPTGDLISVFPEAQFKLEKLRCVPDETYCAVLIDEENGRIYNNVKSLENTANAFTISTPFHSAAVRGPSFYFNPESDGRIWPVRELPRIVNTGVEVNVGAEHNKRLITLYDLLPEARAD